jgi:tetratricopeptide (TPR) repeat protein
LLSVFVNYRTRDAKFGAAACYERLADHFGAQRVFRDCVSMLPGAVYPREIREALERAEVLLVLIGPEWMATDEDGRPLIERPSDWVRREIARSLERDIEVIPVLLDGTGKPDPARLPKEIRSLTYRQIAQVNHRTLGPDLTTLIGQIEERVPELALPEAFEPRSRLPERWLPSMLLEARHDIVPFHGREPEIAALTEWLNGPHRIDARLVIGPGGQGKTRLARRLAERAGADGWAAGFVGDLPAPLLRRLSRVRRPLLLVFDYAETRAEDLSRIALACGARDGECGPVRLLLLARSSGIWHQELRRNRDDEVAVIFNELVVHPLPSLVASTADRHAEFLRAVRAFAPWFDVDPDHQATGPNFYDLRYERILDVHAAALATVLDLVAVPVESTSADPLLRVLHHEQRYWRLTLRAYALPDPHDDRLDQVVAAATLFGAPDPPGARRLLEALPTFAGERPDAIGRYRRWLGELYPGPLAVNPLRPDRLGEDLVAHTLRTEPELGTSLAGIIDEPQLVRALTVLARAAPRHPHVGATITALLSTDPDERLPIGIAIATRVEDAEPLIDAIDLVSAGSRGELDEVIAEHLPERSLALAAFAVVRTRAARRRELDADQPDEHRLAVLTNDLAQRLAAVGAHEEVLSLATEAVDRYTDLIPRQPDLAVEHARSVINLAVALDRLGLHENGLERAEQAVALLRPAADRASERRADLASALKTRGNLLLSLNGRDRALADLTEGVALLRRQLTDDAPGKADELDEEVLGRLVDALDDLGGALAAAGRAEESLDATSQAASAIRLLDAEDPDQFRSGLVRALTNLSASYAELERWPQAYQAAEEAVDLGRSLVDRHGEEHVAPLAAALNNAAVALRLLGRPKEAIRHIDEAILILRRIVAWRPSSLPDLAAALRNLGDCRDDVGDHRAAADAYDESVDLYRKLADPRPDVYEPDLAESLVVLGQALSETDDPDKARDHIAEGVTLFQSLVAAGRAELRSKLARGLVLQATILGELGQYEPAVLAASSAVDLCGTLVDEGSDDLRTVLGSAWYELGRALDAARGPEEADPAAAQAVGVFRALLNGDPDVAEPLADALHDHATVLSALERHDEALAAISEAVRLRREAARPDAVLDLAESLYNLADTYLDLHRLDDAADAATEVLELLDGASASSRPDLRVYALLALCAACADHGLVRSLPLVGAAWRVAAEAPDQELADAVRDKLRDLEARHGRREVRGQWHALASEPYPVRWR